MKKMLGLSGLFAVSCDVEGSQVVCHSDLTRSQTFALLKAHCSVSRISVDSSISVGPSNASLLQKSTL